MNCNKFSTGQRSAVLGVCMVLATSNLLYAAPLAPNDPSIAGNLSVWLRDAENNFDGTTWSDISGNNNNAAAAGLMPIGVTYGAPAPGALLESVGLFSGLNVSGVRFDGATDDLLRVTGINGGAPIGNLTTIIVYSSASNANGLQRPVGFGSLTNNGGMGSASAPVVFNPADDGTIRYDQGQSGAGDLTRPTNQLFVRGSTLASTANPGEGTANDYFDGLANFTMPRTSTPNNGGFPVEDSLYVGDARLGITASNGFSAGTVNDLFVAEVIAYDTALTQQQIADITEWLGINIAVTPFEEFPRLTIDRQTGSMVLENTTASALNIVGYTMTSATGALDPANWIPITDNYDDAAGPGDGSVDFDDAWTILSAADSNTDFSEFEFSGGDGGTIGLGSTIDFGTGNGSTTFGPWIRNPIEDVAMELVLEDGSTVPLNVVFDGNGGDSFELGDLDFDGSLTAGDWQIFKAGFGVDLADLSTAEAYQVGDLDGDFDVDPIDFGIFKSAFNTANGPGAFAAMINSVPEPSTFTLFAVIAFLMVSYRTLATRRVFCHAAVVGLVAAISFAMSTQSHAAPLAPNDPSIAGSLSVWLRDAGTNFNPTTGIWADVSGNGNNAAPAGLTTSGVTFGAPSLFEITPTTGAFSTLSSVGGVMFAGNTDDLLRSSAINGGSPMSDITIITVYSSPAIAGGTNLQRPAGIGSYTSSPSQAARQVVFNQADDRSLRYDYGSSIGTLAQPVDTLFVRGSTLSGSTVNDYFDGAANVSNVAVSLASSQTFPPPEDSYYLGDVRAGITAGSGGGTANRDLFVAEAIVYDTALTQQQIADIGEWLQGNIATFAFARPTLQVNTDTGAMTLTNTFGSDLDIDLYQIAGPANSLNPAAWNSLESPTPNSGQDLIEFPRGDGNGNGWEVLGIPSSESLAEAFLNGSSILGPGQSISLGNAFNTSGPGEGALSFQVRTSAGEIVNSIVEYVTGVSLAGDYNGDGRVDAADYTVWRDNLGAGDESAFAAGTGNGNGIDGSDYTVWRSNFGNTTGSGSLAAAPVPEPSSIATVLLAMFAAIGFAGHRRMSFSWAPAVLGTVVVAIVAWASAGSIAQAAVYNDRVYLMGDDPLEGAEANFTVGFASPFGDTLDSGDPNTPDSSGEDPNGSYIDLDRVGSPNYVDVSTLGSGRTGLGVQFNGGNLLQGIPLNRPEELTSVQPAVNYNGILGHGLQLWVYPSSTTLGSTSTPTTFQSIVADTTLSGGPAINQFGEWTQIGSNQFGIGGSAPVAAGDTWYHIMHQHYPITGNTFLNVLYVDGVAVSAHQGTILTGGSPNLSGKLVVGGSEFNDDGNNATAEYNRFFTGVVDDLELYVYGDNETGTPGNLTDGEDWGTFDLFADNEWIATEITNNITGGILRPGDVNRDGFVTQADVAPFVAGWLSTNTVNGLLVGDWNTWGNGDMNHDGITNVADAYILNRALIGSTGAGLDFSLLNETTVPEPSSTLLIAIAGLGFALRTASLRRLGIRS